MASREDSLLQFVGRLCGGENMALPKALDPELVRAHRLAPLAYLAGFQEFQKDYVAAGLLAELRQRTVDEALEALSGIPVLLLKGISYLGRIYDDPAARPMTDVDLLVSPSRREEALRRLQRKGYWLAGKARERSAWHHAASLKKSNASIDLHCYPMQRWRTQISPDELLQRAIPLPEGGRILEPRSELALHFAMIARTEFVNPLISFVDAARLSSLCQRSHVLAVARRWRVESAAKVGYALLDELRTGSISPESLAKPSLFDLALRRNPETYLRTARKALLCDGPREWLGLVISTFLARGTRWR
jgi:hypothetical protein